LKAGDSVAVQLEPFPVFGTYFWENEIVPVALLLVVNLPVTCEVVM
jgi:hypothetical protein